MEIFDKEALEFHKSSIWKMKEDKFAEKKKEIIEYFLESLYDLEEEEIEYFFEGNEEISQKIQKCISENTNISEEFAKNFLEEIIKNTGIYKNKSYDYGRMKDIFEKNPKEASYEVFKTIKESLNQEYAPLEILLQYLENSISPSK